MNLEFEVYCGTCGAGLCNQSETRESRNRHMPQVTVAACEKCMETARDEGREEVREELNSRIAELERELEQVQTN